MKIEDNGVKFDYFMKSLEGLTGEENQQSTNARGLTAFLYLYFSMNKLRSHSNQNKRSLHVVVKSRLPVGMGLGSSAAFSVSLVAGLAELYHIRACNSECKECNGSTPCKSQLEFINAWAFQAEKIMHGTPSGIDNSVSTFGGTLTLTRTATTPIVHLDKTPSLQFLLINTKVPRNTKALVGKVGDFHRDHPDQANPILDEIHSISLDCIKQFENHNQPREHLCKSIGELMQRNHVLLNKLGVGHESLDKVCQVTSRFGLPSKLTGAGGGGCALSLIPDGIPEHVVQEAKEALEKEGFQCFTAEVGGKGVQLHRQ